MSFSAAIKDREATRDRSGASPQAVADPLGGDALGGDALGTDPLLANPLGAPGGGAAGAPEESADQETDEAVSDDGEATKAVSEVKAGAPGDGDSPAKGKGDEDPAKDGDVLAKAEGEGVEAGDAGAEEMAAARRQPGRTMKLPDSPIPADPSKPESPIKRPPPPKGLETLHQYGLPIPNPFYSKTELSSEPMVAKSLFGGDIALSAANSVGSFGFAKFTSFIATKTANLRGGVDPVGFAGKAGANAALLFGPLTMVAGAVSAGVGIFDAINEGPGLFNTFTNSDLSGFTRAAAFMRGASIATSILAGVAGMVSGGFATAALLLLLTGYGAALLPVLKKIALVVGKIGLGLSVFGVILTVLTTVLQKIGAMDDATRMAGVLKSADQAETNADALVDTAAEADAHEDKTVDEMVEAMNQRGTPPDMKDPFSVMRAHGEAHEQAGAAANIATGLAENLSDENTPLQAALAAHEGSAQHIDMVLGVAREKQALLQEQFTTLSDISNAAGGAGYGIKKVASILSIFNPLLGLLSSPLVEMTAKGEGPLAVINLFGFKVRNPIAIGAAQAAYQVGTGTKDLAAGPKQLVDDTLAPLQALPLVLVERDLELGAAILTLRAAKASHDQAGNILAARRERAESTFHLAKKQVQEKLNLRDTTGPKIKRSMNKVEEDIRKDSEDGEEDAPAGDEAPPA